MSHRRKWILAAAVLCALAALCLALVCALRRGGGGAADPYDGPYSRMKDPEYARALDRQRAQQKEIMLRIAKTREEIAALGDGTNGEAYAALRRRLEAEAAEIEKNRIISQTIVRDRIARENAAVKARQEALKQKGKDK